jgi:hypothetical protein
MTRKNTWKQRHRVVFNTAKLPMFEENAWERGEAIYCLEHQMHPRELGIPDSDRYDLIVACYESMMPAPHKKQASHRSASINQIKNRTGGRNRKERRGS